MLGSSATFILDTGSSISLIQLGVHPNKVEVTEVVPISVTGDKLAIVGQQEVGFSLQQCYFCHRFQVCQLPTDTHGILRTDFLMKTRAHLNLERSELKLTPHFTPSSSTRNSRIRNSASDLDEFTSTIFSGREDGGHRRKLSYNTTKFEHR
jgi:hypothetical protein